MEKAARWMCCRDVRAQGKLGGADTEKRRQQRLAEGGAIVRSRQRLEDNAQVLRLGGRPQAGLLEKRIGEPGRAQGLDQGVRLLAPEDQQADVASVQLV